MHGVGRVYGEPWRTMTRAEEVDDVVMRDSEKGRKSIAPTVDIATEWHVLDSTPVTEARSGCKAYGF